VGSVYGDACVNLSRPIGIALPWLLTLWAIVPAFASNHHPYQLKAVQTLAGRLIDVPAVGAHNLVVVPRAAWEPNLPALELRSDRGQLVASALPQDEVLDATALSNGVLAVVRRASNVEVLALSPNLKVLSRGVIERSTAPKTCYLVATFQDDRNIVIIDDDVYVVSTNGSDVTASLLQTNARAVAILPQAHSMHLAVVHASGPVAYVTFFDRALRARFSPSLPLADAASIDVVDNLVVVRSPIDGGLGTHVAVLSSGTTQPRFLTAPSAPEHVAVSGTNSALLIGYVHVSDGRYVVRVGEVLPVQRQRFEVPIPAEHGRPHRLNVVNDMWFVTTDVGVVVLARDGEVLSSDTIAAIASQSMAFVSHHHQQIAAVSNSKSVLFILESQPWWWFHLFVKEALAYVVPAILLIVIVLIRRHSRRIAAMLDAMLELPGAGMVFHLDASARLLRSNDAGSRLLRITKSVPMRRVFRSYATHKDAEALLVFVQRSHALRLVVTENVVVGSSTGPREYLFTSVPIRGTLGRFVGMLITGVDITEELERRRLVNWAQLAHDMQTNLSTIRLNAEQFKGASTSDVERRRRILFQVGVLIQRVRDLVSVGRSDTLDRVPVHSAELCTDIRHEFDSAVFPHVTFQMKLRGTIMLVDRLKISRAVRNAVENGIKALRNQAGTIEIATWFDRSNVYVRVSDTGIGMDTETLANMMKPHFTTAQDGSGTGIGTMIMQHVMTLHGGSLRVMSAPGKGTQVIFRIPISSSVEASATEFAQSLS